MALLSKFAGEFDAEEIVILGITGDKVTVLNPRKAVFQKNRIAIGKSVGKINPEGISLLLLRTPKFCFC